jgi:hypothetical protein
MVTESLAVATARQNVREHKPSSPVVVRQLLDTIDRLERQAQLTEDDKYDA